MVGMASTEEFSQDMRNGEGPWQTASPRSQRSQEASSPRWQVHSRLPTRHSQERVHTHAIYISLAINGWQCRQQFAACRQTLQTLGRLQGPQAPLQHLHLFSVDRSRLLQLLWAARADNRVAARSATSATKATVDFGTGTWSLGRPAAGGNQRAPPPGICTAARPSGCQSWRAPTCVQGATTRGSAQKRVTRTKAS